MTVQEVIETIKSFGLNYISGRWEVRVYFPDYSHFWNSKGQLCYVYQTVYNTYKITVAKELYKMPDGTYICKGQRTIDLDKYTKKRLTNLIQKLEGQIKNAFGIVKLNQIQEDF